MLHYQGGVGQQTKPVILTLSPGMSLLLVRSVGAGSGVDTFWGNGLGSLFHVKRQQQPPPAAQNAGKELTQGEGNRAELSGVKIYRYEP